MCRQLGGTPHAAGADNRSLGQLSKPGAATDQRIARILPWEMSRETESRHFVRRQILKAVKCDVDLVAKEAFLNLSHKCTELVSVTFVATRANRDDFDFAVGVKVKQLIPNGVRLSQR
jgi:hypothetical protein